MSTRILLDAGHGGTDYGATRNDHIEKDLNIALCHYIKARITHSYEPIEPLMTRRY
jgi:N-acetylmuramoyl-L-alanine amidase